MPALADCRLVMAHGAGSSSDFLQDAFPAAATGVRSCRFVDDRTGSLTAVMTQLAQAADQAVPTVLGGVSLGAHAAAALLARPDRPAHIVGGVVVMPAWTGDPGPVAELTAAAAEALSVLGPQGVLAELDPEDWVTPQLRRSWRRRSQVDLVAELARAATQSAPTEADLRGIGVPVAVIALADDPLHPASVAHQWRTAIPCADLATLPREGPRDDLALFGRTAGRLLEGLLVG